MVFVVCLGDNVSAESRSLAEEYRSSAMELVNLLDLNTTSHSRLKVNTHTHTHVHLLAHTLSLSLSPASSFISSRSFTPRHTHLCLESIISGAAFSTQSS